jgi:hypothetical protein
MRKISLIMALSLVVVFALGMQAWAFNVISLVPGDLNYKITNVDGHAVFEDYNATIVYGNQVVDPGPIYFQKQVEFLSTDPNPFEINWHITNTTDFTWTDYHFIFVNEGQTIAATPLNSDRFATVTTSGSTSVSCSDGSVAPGQTVLINMQLDWGGGSFLLIDLRQVATVPLPPTLPLFGSGLLGLIGLAWRKVRA